MFPQVSLLFKLSILFNILVKFSILANEMIKYLTAISNCLLIKLKLFLADSTACMQIFSQAPDTVLIDGYWSLCVN